MSIRLLKGSYWVDFRNGFQRVRKRSPVQTLAAAKDYEALLRSRLMRGEPLQETREPSAKTTFAEFAWEWHETYVRANNKASEQYIKAIYLRVHLVPFFGNLPLRDISSESIERYKGKKRAAGLSDTTINHHLTTLMKCLRCAQEWGRIPLLPKVRKIKTAPPPFDFLTPPESEQLLRYARLREPTWHDMILLGLRTGMRRGELLGLQWADVDLDKRKITVRHSLVMGLLSCPKNYRFRYLPMTQEVFEMLSERHSQTGYVFQGETGGASSPATIDRNLRRICKQAGMRHIHWHVFRHTFASQLVTAGVPLTVVKELMGHADIKMTTRYSHFAPSLYDSAVNVLDTLGKLDTETLGQPMGNRAEITAPTTYDQFSIIRLNGQQKQATV